jgi:hypothetical protein
MPPQPTPVLQPLATPFASATTPTLRQPIQPQPQAQPQSHVNLRAKFTSEVAKQYTDELKYNGNNGSFDQKLVIFLDICKRSELSIKDEDLLRAFPIMLKGLALDQYYNA